ncbi:MAG: peptide chain release factor 1 [Christensenellaceae bacterium]|nr:peptide chain release factor 1 [Christensenellaceae bacterium]
MAKAKLESYKIRYDELNKILGDPDASFDNAERKKLTKAHSDLLPVIELYDEILSLEAAMDESKELMNGSDKEMAEYAESEYYSSREKLAAKEEQMKFLLIPKDPLDEKNVILEIRPAAGGDESALFGYELLKMYRRFTERMRWKWEEIDVDETELGGIKSATAMISGNDIYSRMKYESGVHRVQRVPATESQGRVHTSTVTIAVLPEAEDVELEINEKDLRIDTYRSSGAGGQHVNKTESAIRITHIPTGIVVACQDERSQIKNRDKAMKVLKTRLFDAARQENDKKYSDYRKSQVGTGDRSERIRTYNFPQGRVSDHRINLTLYSIGEFMDGDLTPMIDALALADMNAKLSAQGEE